MFEPTGNMWVMLRNRPRDVKLNHHHGMGYARSVLQTHKSYYSMVWYAEGNEY